MSESSQKKRSSKYLNTSSLDINITLHESSNSIDGYESNYCKLLFTGKDINFVLINTLRRTILTIIPVYAFDIKNININKNTSIFNNDQLRLRLSNLPIYSKNDVDLINPHSTIESFKNLEYNSSLMLSEIDKTIISEKEDITNNLTISVNVKNIDSNDILNVMTDNINVKYSLNKQQIENIYAKPILLLQLQPEQSINFTMISSLNNAIYNSTFRCCSKCHYEEISENKFIFELHSRRQITEKEIILRACEILISKITNTHQILVEKINEHGNANKEGNIIIEGEQHTLGNLLSLYLQEHKDVIFAAYKINNPNINQVEFIYKTDKNIILILEDIHIKLLDIFNNIISSINNLSPFGYNIM